MDASSNEKCPFEFDRSFLGNLRQLRTKGTVMNHNGTLVKAFS